MPHKDPIKRAQCRKRWEAKNPTWHQDTRRAHPERYQAYNRKARMKRLYGLTIAEYEAMARDQQGVCALCGAPPRSNSRLHVDHNHATKILRKLLCLACNTKLHVLENTEFRQKAEAYLMEYEG